MAAARSLPRKLARRSAQVVLALLLMLGALLLSVFGVLQTSWGRERLRLVVNDALSEVFQGKILIDRIGSVALWGVSGVDARIYDPAGRQVIAAHDLRALASLPTLAYQFVVHSDRPEIALPLVHIQHADVALREDAELGVTLAATFLPRESEEPEPIADPTAGPRLHLGRIVIDRIWAHGRASGSPDLDADLLDLRASLSQSPLDGFGLDLARVDLVSRGMPLAADPRGRASGRIELPPDGAGPMHLELALDGRAAESPLSLEAVWVGDDLFARAALPRLPATYLNRLAPGLALDGDVTVIASVDGELPQLDFDAEIDSTGAHVHARGYGVLADGRELSLRMDAARVDLSRIVEGGPKSDLRTIVSALLFEQDDGQFVGSQHVAVDASRIAGVATPPLWITGSAQLDSDTLVARGQLGVAEAGADLNGTYAVELPFAGAGGKVAAAVRARLDEPERLSALGVRTKGTVEVSGKLDLASQAIAAQASVSLSRVEREELTARNVEVQARASGTLTRPQLKVATTFDALSGRAHADLDYTPERQQLALFVADWDLLRLSRLLGAEMPLKQGTLNLDARVEVAQGTPPRLDAKAKADFGKVGVVDITARALELPATAPTVASLERLRGDLEAKGNVDLAELSPYVTAANLPIERSTGRVRFEAAVKGKTAERGLEVSARVATNALRIVQERKTPEELRTTAQAIDNTPFALEGIDVHLAAHSELESGLVVATLILRDRGGTLAEAQAEARIAELLSPRAGDVASLEHMPLRATLQVPERRLQTLPPLLRPAALRGRVALDVALEGSVADPRVEAVISGKSLRASGSRDPVSVNAEVKYAPPGGELTLRAVQARGGAEVARIASRWQGDLRRAGLLAEGSSGITGSTSVALREFPLDVVPPIVDRQVTGRVNGDFELRDWGRAARVVGKLSSTSLVVGRIPVERFEVSAETDDQQARAEVAMKVGSGISKATLDAGVRWGKRPLPELEHRGALKIETHAFKLETLSPLLGAYVSELGGVLDASTQVTVTPNSTRLAGQAKLERGVVQVPAVGQRFSDISARLSVENDEFKLEQLQARGTTGRVTVKGSARLDGFALRSASANVAIAKHEAIPLTIEGAVLGDAWGNIQAKLATPEKGAKRLEIDVQRFHLLTPENSGSGLQSLDEPESIRVGVRRADGKFVPLAVQPLEPGGAEEEQGAPAEPLLITVKLGNDVVVERGRTATAQLTGQLRIESARETSVTGRIEVRGGKLDVSGKTFDIERGVVTFDGRDPGNPTITATARWDAPGYTVYAEYLGDVENGRIKLRSEPPLSQDEIASLLLFGSPDGSVGGGSSDNASLAVSVAGDTAAKGLNQVLDDFTNLDVSARVDTTTGSARPELVFQVTPRLAAKVTRAVGAPTANESPDRTFLTLELRLKRAWALSAVVGDHGGSALDLIWRRRY